MWSDVIVQPSPPGHQHFGLLQSGKDLTIEQFVSDRPIKALDVDIFLGAASFDKERLEAKSGPSRVLSNTKS